MSNIWLRIKEIVFKEYKGKYGSLEKASGLSNGYLKKTIEEERNISPEILEKIIQSHPEIDHNWFFYGVGTMKKPTLPQEIIEAAEMGLIFSVKEDIDKGNKIEEEAFKSAYISLFTRYMKALDILKRTPELKTSSETRQ